MKRSSFIFSVLTTVVFVHGCGLPEAIPMGEPCTGVDRDHITFAQGICENNSCEENIKHSLSKNHCPDGLACFTSKDGVNSCKPACRVGEAKCGGECINPEGDIEYCGAKAGGKCDDPDPDSNDYAGEKCEDGKTCLSGQCVSNDCPDPDRQHPVMNSDGTFTCETDSSAACGSTDVKCKEGESCIAKKCTKECGSKTQVVCNGECIEPSTDSRYCGAKENCKGAWNCESMGQQCIGGKCTTVDCSNEGEMLCKVDGENKCIDVTSDANNCGSCNRKCEESEPLHAETRGCDKSECVYACEDGYQNCGTDSKPNCVDLTSDNKNCGSCGKTCEANEYCQNSTCNKNTCTGEYECGKSGQCLTHDPTGCGRECKVCDVDLNSYESTCDDVGVCHVVKCQNGYHFVSDTQMCEQNAQTSCGSTDKSDAVDCTSLPDVQEVQCINGTCIIGECSAGYHLHENTCEADSDDNCGAHGIKCVVSNGTSACQGGECKTTACDSGYHQEENYCTGDNTSSCGDQDCSKLPGWKAGNCINSTCIATACDKGYYLDEPECKVNNQDNCGAKGKKCTVNNGSGSCDISKGECVFEGCSSGFHRVGSECIQDSVSACGQNAEDCLSKTGWKTADCKSGECQATGCESGFHLYQEKSTCENNSISNCLSHGNACSDSNAVGVKCDDTKGCQVNGCNKTYHASADNSKCVINSNAECGAPGLNCTTPNSTAHYTSATCDINAGVCLPQKCATDPNEYVLLNKVCVEGCYLVQINNYGSSDYYCCQKGNWEYCRQSKSCNSCRSLGMVDINGDMTYEAGCITPAMIKELEIKNYTTQQIYCPREICEVIKMNPSNFTGAYLSNLYDILNNCFVNMSAGIIY